MKKNNAQLPLPLDDTQQLSLPLEVEAQCYYKGCTQPVVCHSIRRDGGQVCDYHNVLEWGQGLARSRDYKWMGRALLADLETKGTASPP